MRFCRQANSVCVQKSGGSKFLEKAKHLSMIIKRKDKKKYASYCQALGAPLLMAALLFWAGFAFSTVSEFSMRLHLEGNWHYLCSSRCWKWDRKAPFHTTGQPQSDMEPGHWGITFLSHRWPHFITEPERIWLLGPRGIHLRQDIPVLHSVPMPL